MSEALQTSNQTNSGDSPNATSSPALESGATPCALPDGTTTDLFGRAVAPVRVSVPQEKAKGLMTLATSGRLGLDLSASADLQRCLESRLMQRLDTAGSTLFNLTWKRKNTPLGRRYLERAVSARRTSGSGFSSWPSPIAQDSKHSGLAASGPGQAEKLVYTAQLSAWPSPSATKNTKNSKDPQRMKENGVQTALADAAHLAGWPTPQTHDDRERGNTSADHHHSVHDLSNAATLAGWPTPNWQDSAGGGQAKRAVNPARSNDLNDFAQLASWASPKAEDAESAGMRHGRGVADTLTAQSSLVSPWATPAARDAKGPNSELHVLETGTGRKHMDQLANQAVHYCEASGGTPNGSTAATGSGGQLNPALPRWLMGLPLEWDACAVTAMQSAPRSRKRSSNHI